MVKQTQNDRILQFLKEGKRITPMYAMQELGVMRLAARVRDLRDLGYNVACMIKTHKNRWNEPVRYAEYWLDLP